MSNINSGQFFNNLVNSFNRAAMNNIQNTVSANQQAQELYTAQQLLPQTTAQLTQTLNELSALNQQQTINMLKDLLQFPKNFEQILQQLTVTSQTARQNTALMLLASNLNLSQLSSLLQSSSKEALTNLYQMLAQYNQLGVNLKNEQLGQISKLISFVSASSTSDVLSLKTLMLMYLPWLPLTDPDAFKLEMAQKESGGAVGSDDSVTILIKTENYGNLQAEINKTGEDGIKIELTSSETFPQKDFVLLMKEESKKYSININFELSRKEAFNKTKNEKSQTQVCMNTSPGVNPFLILISNALIKNVHTIDSKENLREQRKEKVDNGKS